MANTYTQIHIQAVFVVKNRDCVIKETWEDELYKYITGIIQSHGHKVLAINGMPDHLHVLFGLRPSQSLSDLLQDVKTNSSKWINEKKFMKTKFSWQPGYGAFSYSNSHVQRVINYIKNQKNHHKKKTFSEEYKVFLDKFEVDYNERYVFQPVNY
ncbi:MAG: IS200/IS605 family transposase [Crocinitomicaceae bacterium]|nr:IS200/IS605 family transposase [Crocinitomicaceae bacterium]